MTVELSMISACAMIAIRAGDINIITTELALTMLHNCVLPKQSMNLGIKVITEVDDSVCGQYIGFCKVYGECLKKYKDDRSRILDETVNIYNKKGYYYD